MALFDTIMPNSTALCFVPESNNQQGEVLVKWRMGFALFGVLCQRVER